MRGNNMKKLTKTLCAAVIAGAMAVPFSAAHAWGGWGPWGGGPWGNNYGSDWGPFDSDGWGDMDFSMLRLWPLRPPGLWWLGWSVRWLWRSIRRRRIPGLRLWSTSGTGSTTSPRIGRYPVGSLPVTHKRAGTGMCTARLVSVPCNRTLIRGTRQPT
jgi:hypothetical protein